MDSRLHGNDMAELRAVELRGICAVDFTCTLELAGKAVRNGINKDCYFLEGKSKFCFRSGV